MKSLLLFKIVHCSIFLVIAIFGVGCSERQKSTFESYAELEKSGLIGKGWVPKFIPKSAYGIKESHRVDQPYINVEFSFQKGDISGIKENCSKENENTYECDNSGYPVKVEIIGDNYIKIYSVPSST